MQTGSWPGKNHPSTWAWLWTVWSKTDLPHLIRKNKMACNMWVLRTHITGALIHGRRFYAFVDVHMWPHDSNLTMNIFLSILLDQSKEVGLPSILFLQLDNCSRENKNQFVFGLLALLVQKKKKIFKEVSDVKVVWYYVSKQQCEHSDWTWVSDGWAHPWGHWSVLQ